MTDPKDDDQSMEAILRRVRQRYVEDELQDQGGEAEAARTPRPSRPINPSRPPDPARR
jgi:hypothetical protein